MSGMAVRIPVKPAGMESVALIAADFIDACWTSNFTRSSGVFDGLWSESGISVMRSKMMLTALSFSFSLVSFMHSDICCSFFFEYTKKRGLCLKHMP